MLFVLTRSVMNDDDMIYWSRYYYHTRDHELILTHLPKIAGLGQFLNRRFELAKTAGYPQSDSRYAMPTGNDEADMFFGTVVGYNTELPFISIAGEMWRGLRDCGEALAMIAASLDSSSDAAKQATEASKMMLSNTASLLANLRASMEKDRFVQDGTVCHPCLLRTLPTMAPVHGNFTGNVPHPLRTYRY